MKHKTLLRAVNIFLLLLSCSILSPVSAITNQFRGVNWADSRDNFQTGNIYLSGISSTDTYASASVVAERVIGQFVSKLGSNSVRLPINEPTVSNFWNTYTGVIDVALTKGKVILCFWSNAHGAKPANMTAYWAMWKKVTDKYGSNPNCYFEVYNEPSSYSKTDLLTLYDTWLMTYPTIPQGKIILDGTGLAMNVPDIGNDPRFKNCLLAVHDYSMWGNFATEQQWKNHLKGEVGSFSDRTVMTEFGGPMKPGTKDGVNYGVQDYNSPPGTFFVAYLRGMTSQLRDSKMGSFYWVGLKDNDWYSLTTKTGTGATINLTVNNQSGLERIQYSWGDVNQAPIVTLTAPINNATYTSPSTVNLTATASDADGTIDKVEFYNGTSKLGEDANSPYTFSWLNVAKGSYILTAVATDNYGNKTTSLPDTITVNVPQSPYNGIVHPIPGIIEVEEYDLGGNGFAYKDDSPGNTGGATFRIDEDVDLETCTDAGGGYNVGFATAGEWLEYTVIVKEAGSYDLDLRVACNGDGRTVSLMIDGVNFVTTIDIPNTGGWQTWTTVTVKNFSLKAGKQMLRLTIGATSYVNVNYINFKPPVLLGLENFNTSGTSFYPNPFDGNGLKINKEGAFRYKISDVSGSELEQGFGENEHLVGTNLKQGVYLLSVENGSGRFVQKIVKQ